MKFILLVFIFSFSILSSYEHGDVNLNDDIQENNSILILSQLTSKEADEITRFLEKNGIEVEKRGSSLSHQTESLEKTWNLYVPLLHAVEAVTLLDDADLPEREPSQLFEEFLKRQRKFGQEFAFENEELAKLIETLPGVINAEVLIQEKTDANQQKKMTAIIYVKHNGTLDDVHGKTAQKIKEMAIEEVPNLLEKNVTFIPDKEAKKSYKLPSFE